MTPSTMVLKSTFEISQHKQTLSHLRGDLSLLSPSHTSAKTFFGLSLLINYISGLKEWSILFELVEACMTTLCCVTMWKACLILKARYCLWKLTPYVVQTKERRKKRLIHGLSTELKGTDMSIRRLLWWDVVFHVKSVYYYCVYVWRGSHSSLN